MSRDPLTTLAAQAAARAAAEGSDTPAADGAEYALHTCAADAAVLQWLTQKTALTAPTRYGKELSRP